MGADAGDIRASLRVRGNTTPVRDLRSLPIGTSWDVGDPRPGSPVMRYREAGWEVYAEVATDRPLVEHVRQLQRRVALHEVEIKQAIASAYGELSVALYVEDQWPELHLPRDVIAWLAHLGCAIDLDGYSFTLGPSTSDPDRSAPGEGN